MSAWSLITVAVEREADVVVVRQRARRIAELLGFDIQDQTRIATAVSEIARNTIIYATEGHAEFALSGPEIPQRLVIRVSDKGPGIEDIDAVLNGRVNGQTSAGRGILGARRLMDGIVIETVSGKGAVVTLDKHLPRNQAAVTVSALAEIARRLASETTGDALAEVRAQNLELLRSLDELRARQEETERLNKELETTNKGVVALYAELDQKAIELQGLNASLEDRVASAIAEREKAEETLRQSQKMEAVGQLTGGLAHDFNNLLAGISGSLELLQARISQGRVRDLGRYIIAAQGAASRAAAITHRLLAFSRQQTLDPKTTEVNRLIANMAELIRRTVGPAITVETVLAGGLWPVLCDPNQLENALLNFCINARDAMPEGGRLTVETANSWLDDQTARERDCAPGQYVALCVTDTGTGMTPEVIARAFDPFFTTKPIGTGTGLGLSMIYGFARQSGGMVRAYSEMGEGTTMRLYLPRHHGAADQGDPPRLEPAGQAKAEAGETVLVVDDEPTVRMLVTEVLEDLGYGAIESSDGAAALQILDSDIRLDLLITDVGLPGGMNGRQLADAGRAVRPDLKVLFITGYAENAVISHGHLKPGMRILTKPFSVQALVTHIRDIGPASAARKVG